MKLQLPSLRTRTVGRRESDTALGFLAHLAGDFSAVLNLNDLLSHVTRACRTELGFESCSVALLDEDGGGLTVRATSGLRDRYRDLKIPAGQGLHGEVVRTQRPLSVPDMAADPRAWQLKAGVGSGIYVPLIAHGRFVGVLSAHRAAPRAFTQTELDLLNVVAKYVADAIEAARLHARLEDQAHNWNHQLTQALDLVDVAMLIAALEDGTILRWNRAAADLYGYSQEEVVGRPVTMLAGPERKHVWDEVRAALRREDPVTVVHTMHIGKDGRTRRVSLRTHPMRNGAGAIRWALIIARLVPGA